MVDVRQDPQTGQLYIYRKGFDDYVPVSEEEAKAASRGGVETFLRSAGANMVDLVSDVEGALPGVGLVRQGLNAAGYRTPFQEAAASNDAAQSARMEMRPGLEVAGMLADPTMMIGGGSVGAGRAASRAAATATQRKIAQGVQLGVDGVKSIADSAPVRVAKSAASSAARKIPFASEVAEETATDLAGRGVRNQVASMAAEQRAALGQTALRAADDVALVMDDLAPQAALGGRVVDQSLSAAENPANASRYRPMLQTPDEFAEEVGVQIGDDLSVMLNARDAAEYQDARKLVRQLEADEVAQGGGELTARLEGIQTGINEKWLQETGAAQQFGTDVLPDRDLAGSNLTRISNDFDALYDEVDGMIDLSDVATNMRQRLNEDYGVSRKGEQAVEKALRDLDDMTRNSKYLSMQELSKMNNRLTKSITQAASRSSDTEVVELLTDLKERIGARIAKVMTPEQRARDEVLRRQWGLTKSAVTRENAFGQGGLNVKPYLSSLGSNSPAVKTGRSDDSFVNTLRTAAFLLSERLPMTGARLQRDLRNIKEGLKRRPR